MKTIIMTATLAVLANVSYAVDNSAFDQLKNNVPNIELPNAPIPNIKVFEAPAAHRSNSFDQTAFLYDLAHALGETSVVRAPWAIDDISQPQGRILTAKQAQQLADRLSADRKIPFKYLKDGCTARAHIVCDALHKEGIAGAKIFADSSSDDRGPSFRAHGELMAADWPWHVAPLIYVQDGKTGKVGVRIIDLGLSHKPLSVAEWLGLFRNGATVTIDLANDAQYEPRKSGNEKRETFESNLPEAQATSAGAARQLDMTYLDGPDNTESTVIGPFATKIVAALRESLQNDNVIWDARYIPLFKNPVVTEVLARPKNGYRSAKVKAAYTLPSAEIAAKIVDGFGPDSMESENLLTDNVNLPEGSDLITATAYSNQVIFFVYYKLPHA